jgi:hypothetical protein
VLCKLGKCSTTELHSQPKQDISKTMGQRRNQKGVRKVFELNHESTMYQHLWNVLKTVLNRNL